MRENKDSHGAENKDGQVTAGRKDQKSGQKKNRQGSQSYVFYSASYTAFFSKLRMGSKSPLGSPASALNRSKNMQQIL